MMPDAGTGDVRWTQSMSLDGCGNFAPWAYADRCLCCITVQGGVVSGGVAPVRWMTSYGMPMVGIDTGEVHRGNCILIPGRRVTRGMMLRAVTMPPKSQLQLAVETWVMDPLTQTADVWLVDEPSPAYLDVRGLKWFSQLVSQGGTNWRDEVCFTR